MSDTPDSTRSGTAGSAAHSGMRRFSAVLPQGASLELSGLDGAQSWRTLTETAELAAGLGYRELWLLDRGDTMPRREAQPVHEGWIALAALAGRLPGTGLRVLAPPAPARNAGLLAKQAATLDVLSGGRFGLGLSAGPVLPEHESIGLAAAVARPEPDPDRLAALAETADALRTLWTGRPATFDGRWVRLRDAHAVPVPQQPRLPLAVRLEATPNGPDLLPETLLRQVDTWQWVGEPAEVARAIATIGRRRADLALDPAASRHEVALECRLFESEADRDRWFATPNLVVFWSRHPDLLARRSLYGTPDQVRAAADRYLAAGVEGFVVWFRDYPHTTSLRELASQVVPALDAAEPVLTGPGAA